MTRDVMLLDMFWGGGDEVLSRVAELAPDMDIIVTSNEDEIRAVYDRITIAVSGPKRVLLGRAPRLQWMQLWSAGADFLQQAPDLIDLPFLLTNTSGIHAIPIGEHVFSMILFFTRNLKWAVDYQRENTWAQPDANLLYELDGKTMLILGLGAIGQRTARLAQAFGMYVIGTKRSVTEPIEYVDELLPMDCFHEALSRADYVVNALPYTAETYHLFDASAFAACKPGSYFANVGRGKTVDEQALIAALESKHLAGAGLDVFEDEHLSSESPLWQMPNVLVTAHWAGFTPEYTRRASDIFCDNLIRFQQGRPLCKVVDKKLGY